MDKDWAPFQTAEGSASDIKERDVEEDELKRKSHEAWQVHALRSHWRITLFNTLGSEKVPLILGGV